MIVAENNQPLDELIDECAIVNAWRWHQFKEMGFSKGAAEKLARSRADTHAVRRARARGCSKSLVMQVFT